MKHVKPKFQQLSIAAIEQSQEIQSWLSQFADRNQQAAKMLLHHLKFVSNDEFLSPIRRAIEQLPGIETHALYSVRKLDKTQAVFWDESGNPVVRPGASQGSEDLVYSLVSNLVRSNNERFLDHPSLSVLRDKKVRNYILIDDSIGSGDRVSNFINAMLTHRTFRSWWSFGWVRLHVISFARPQEAEAKIIAKIRGSDHGRHEFRKSDKILFTSEIVYKIDWYKFRWGERCDEVKSLCEEEKKIPKDRRLGYGDVMANIIFYHSVPNNVPGVLWCNYKKWKGLLPGRSVPSWLLGLLTGTSSSKGENVALTDELLELLMLVKRGVRSAHSLAIRLGVDHGYAVDLIGRAKELGLLTMQARLTDDGLDRLLQSRKRLASPRWDRSLYTPTSWCADRTTVQPPTS